MAILIAMTTDWLDGYLARRHKMKSQLGAFLDPFTDKFFVIFALTVLYSEHPFPVWQIIAILCRDISVVIYGFYLMLRGHWTTYKFRAIWCGKVTTVIQFFVIFALTLRITVPDSVFSVFIILGILALGELYLTNKRRASLASVSAVAISDPKN